MFTIVENKKIAQMVIEQIQEMIMNDQLKAGDRLPPERELTEQLKIGRPALREALKSLEVMGLVECRHGLGNYIVNNVEHHFFKPLSLAFKLGHQNPQEILEFRYLIEDFAVHQAATSATLKEIQNLRTIHQSMVDADSSSEKSRFDMKFHFELVRICDNTLILSTYESISYLLDSFFDHTVRISYLHSDSVEKIYAEHTTIIDAIQRKDPKQAMAALERHLGNINIHLFSQADELTAASQIQPSGSPFPL